MNALTSLNCRPVQVLERSISHNRLPHAIILYGGSFSALETAGCHIARQLLKTERPVMEHPDLFVLRPANKMRQIGADPMRQLIGQLQQSSHQGGDKVVLIFEADRLNATASNAFLKTLEEPPERTSLLLLTTQPNKLLPTIRSRCVLFSIPATQDPIQQSDWQEWKTAYSTWLSKLIQPNHPISDSVMQLYGLIATFEKTLSILAKTAWKETTVKLPESCSEEERTALEIGAHKQMRQQLFREIAWQTRLFAIENIGKNRSLITPFTTAIANLEEISFLTNEANFNELAALESFLLASLKAWSER